MAKGVRIANPREGQQQFTSKARADYYVSAGRAEIMDDGSLLFLGDPPKPECEPIEKIRQVGNSGTRTRRPIRERTGPTPEELHWRESVLNRDGYKCVFCGDTERLEADHIQPKHIYPDLKYAVDNGRTLCHPCHAQTETYGAKVHRIVSVCPQ